MEVVTRNSAIWYQITANVDFFDKYLLMCGYLTQRRYCYFLHYTGWKKIGFVQKKFLKWNQWKNKMYKSTFQVTILHFSNSSSVRQDCHIKCQKTSQITFFKTFLILIRLFETWLIWISRMGTTNSPSFIRIKIKNKNFWLELLTMTFDRTTACKPGLPLCNAFFFTDIKIKIGICLEFFCII